MSLSHEEHWGTQFDFGTCHSELQSAATDKVQSDSRQLLEDMFSPLTASNADVYGVFDPFELLDHDFVKKNNERLQLLARKYATESTKEFVREYEARLTIREEEVDCLNPRFSVAEHEFLSSFEQQIKALENLQK